MNAAMNASIVAMLATNETGSSQKSSRGKSGETSPSNNVAPTTVILELNPNDVIQGRGTGPCAFEGSVKFRALIKEYKEEYTSAETKRHVKSAIANKVFNEIRSRGGRFVRMKKAITVRGGVVYKEEYYEVEEKVALEKCKQALRQLVGRGERRSDASSPRKRAVKPPRKPPAQSARTSTMEESSSSYGELSSQLERLQMNQLRRLQALQRSKPSAIHARTPPPIDSSSARIKLLRRAQIAAQEKADLYKQALIQLASQETIGASLPVVGHLSPSASAHRQATTLRPSLSPTQPRAVPQSLLHDLAAYRLANSRNESLRRHASAARPEAAQTNLWIHSGRIEELTSQQPGILANLPDREPDTQEQKPRARNEWYKRFAELEEYSRLHHGSCSIPSEDPQYKSLYKWLSRQKYEHHKYLDGKKNSLTVDMIKKLRAIACVPEEIECISVPWTQNNKLGFGIRLLEGRVEIFGKSPECRGNVLDGDIIVEIGTTIIASDNGILLQEFRTLGAVLAVIKLPEHQNDSVELRVMRHDATRLS